MSCETNSNRAARLGCACGLPRLAGKGAYNAGLGGLRRWPGRLVGWLGRAWQKVFQNEDGAEQRPIFDLASIPELSGRDIVQPTPTDRLAGKQCSGCQAWPERKPGPWYVIEGQAHCQDCAPGAAREVGLALALAPLRATQAVAPTSRPPTRLLGWPASPARPAIPARTGPASDDDEVLPPTDIILTSAVVPVAISDTEAGGERQVEVPGYRVLTQAGQETGLAVTSQVISRPNAAGDMDIGLAEDAWGVTHLGTGRAIAAGFGRREEAQELAARLATLDWTRPYEAIPRAEVETAVRTIHRFRQELAGLQAAARAAQEVQAGGGLETLDGEFVYDAFNERLVQVVDDQGGRLGVLTAEGEVYQLPVGDARAPTPADYERALVARPLMIAEQPAEDEPLRPCAGCGVLSRDRPGTRWFEIGANIFCGQCAPEIAAETEYTLPEDFGVV